MKLYGIFPPCFQKERNKGGIFHNGRFLAKISTIFPTVLDLWVLKNFACGAILIVFLIFMLIAAPFSLFWRPRQANLNCQLPMKPVQNTSDRWWMIYRRRRRFFFALLGIEIVISKAKSIEKLCQKVKIFACGAI